LFFKSGLTLLLRLASNYDPSTFTSQIAGILSDATMPGPWATVFKTEVIHLVGDIVVKLCDYKL
jgi:hypothetical protein